VSIIISRGLGIFSYWGLTGGSEPKSNKLADMIDLKELLIDVSTSVHFGLQKKGVSFGTMHTTHYYSWPGEGGEEKLEKPCQAPRYINLDPKAKESGAVWWKLASESSDEIWLGIN
jgi:hypothetical protein